MIKYFAPKINKLLFAESEATPEHWDRLWKSGSDLRKRLLESKGNSLVYRMTAKFIKSSDGPILEGGCGRGHYVYELKKSGFNCIGVDFAEDTIKKLNACVPEIDVRYGDVRHLDFEDNYFLGYWSLGVIEHFWEGYEDIAKEMVRVLKPQGFLFLVFPYISLLRKLKAVLHIYPRWDKEEPPAGFYQFALDAHDTASFFKKFGFETIQIKMKDGIKGTMDEIPFFQSVLKHLYEYNGSNILIRIIRKAFEITLSPIAGHSIIMVMRLNK